MVNDGKTQVDAISLVLNSSRYHAWLHNAAHKAAVHKLVQTLRNLGVPHTGVLEVARVRAVLASQHGGATLSATFEEQVLPGLLYTAKAWEAADGRMLVSLPPSTDDNRGFRRALNSEL